MASAIKEKKNTIPDKSPVSRKTKFQADLAPAEDGMMRSLKAELQMTSNTDFLSDALALFRWAVSERKRGHRIVSESATGERRTLVFPRLERVAPDVTLPQADIRWTEMELDSMAELLSGKAAEPTQMLAKAMRS